MIWEQEALLDPAMAEELFLLFWGENRVYCHLDAKCIRLGISETVSITK